MADRFVQDIGQLAQTLNRLSQVEGPRAVSAALNKAGAQIKSQVVREVAKAASVPAKAVRKKVFLQRATARTGKAYVTAYRTPLAAINLGTAKTTGLRGRGGKARGKRGKGAVLQVGRHRFERAFINRVRSNNQFHVLQRKGKERNPIDVAHVPIKDQVDAAVPKWTRQIMQQKFDQLLRHELQYRVNKHG